MLDDGAIEMIWRRMHGRVNIDFTTSRLHNTKSLDSMGSESKNKRWRCSHPCSILVAVAGKGFPHVSASNFLGKINGNLPKECFMVFKLPLV